jgi:thiol-disulfide isomerase/thioredoxin
MRLLGTTAVLMLISSMSCVTKSPDQLAETDAGSISREIIQLTELSGERIDLSQYEGKVVFINVWATWCAPCVREIPSIARVQQQFDDSQIEFLLASNETHEQIREFVNEAFGDTHVVRLENFEELGVQAMPATFIFDTHGELVFSETGLRLWDEKSSIDLLSGIIAR